MSQLKFRETTTKKVSVKGVLSDDGTYVTYVNDDKDEQDIKISELLTAFKGNPIEFSVSLKTEEELDLPFEAE